MLLMLDNYDSFTYNLVQFFSELKQDVIVIRNDELEVSDIISLKPERIVISPGPCDPKKAGISLDVLDCFAGKLPILGVCLGHQCIGEYFGGEIIKAKEVMHGKTSSIYHDNMGVFKYQKNPLQQTRYHSLVINSENIPTCLEITAWTKRDDGSNDEIMGVIHKEYNIEGVQFHPESILSEQGDQLLSNFLARKGGMR